MDLSIKIWNFEGKLIKSIDDILVSCVCLSFDSKYIISGSWDKTIIILNIEGKILKSIDKAHDNYIFTLCISADSKYIISGSGDK
jgi:WD40 repeat protein